MRYSTIVPAIAVRIRRTAGCSSMRSTSIPRRFRNIAATRDALARVRAGDVIDYVAIAALKWRALRSAFETFAQKATRARRQDFENFRAERGPLLSHFACFEMLRHKFKKPWWEWPES